MRTRSGSLDAVLARVPSHPAHSGVLCICAANASSQLRPPTEDTPPSTRQKDGGTAVAPPTALETQRLVGVRSFSTIGASFNTGAGAGTLVLNSADMNTAVGAAALLLNIDGTRNTAVGAGAMVNNAGDADGNGSFNDAVGAFALNGNTTGFSNNAMGDSALFRNTIAAAEYRRW